MLTTLGSVIEYIGLAALVVFGIIGLYYQARIILKKENRDEKNSQSSSFKDTITLMKSKMDLQQEEINDLKQEVQSLKELNTTLRNDNSIQNERANHYLALFAVRCPYEVIKQGKADCEYFHPYDRQKIREQIMDKVKEESSLHQPVKDC